VENIPGHRDHHSGVPKQLITISPEWVITIVWNPDHDHPGIGDHDRPESLITIVRNPQFAAVALERKSRHMKADGNTHPKPRP